MRETEGDWTTFGVIYYKTSATSKNGNAYTRWSITDLVGEIQTVSVMLFGKAQAKYYSMPQNRVVGLLNPKILEDRSGKGENRSTVVADHLVDDGLTVNHLAHDPVGHLNLRSPVE